MHFVTFGNRVRAARQAKDLTLEEASRLLGISTATLFRIESGITQRPRSRVAHQISAVLGVTPDQTHEEVS